MKMFITPVLYGHYIFYAFPLKYIFFNEQTSKIQYGFTIIIKHQQRVSIFHTVLNPNIRLMFFFVVCFSQLNTKNDLPARCKKYSVIPLRIGQTHSI